MGMGCARYFNLFVEWEKLLQKVKTAYFHFSSCVEVLGDIADWWLKDCEYAVMWSKIQLSPTVIASVWGRTMGSIANGGRKTAWWVNKCAVQLQFQSNFKKWSIFFEIFSSCMRIPDAWIKDNLEVNFYDWYMEEHGTVLPNAAGATKLHGFLVSLRRWRALLWMSVKSDLPWCHV
jgi:hypothetical protein